MSRQAPPDRSPDGSPSRSSRRLPSTVLALGAVSFFTDLSSEMIFPLLPVFLAGTLGAGALALGAVEGAAETVAALLKLVSGWWSDRLSRRKPLVVAGYVLATLVRPLIGSATSAGQVLGLRVTDRVGKGLRSSPRDALIADAVDPAVRGRAFGFHRAADHAGALVGPLVAFALLTFLGLGLRQVFWLSLVPGLAAVAVLLLAVRERPRPEPAAALPTEPAAEEPAAAALEPGPAVLGAPEGGFRRYLVVLLVFTLGNSTDAFLLLRALELGVAQALIPLLWAFHHLVKALVSTPGGSLADRFGRRRVITLGWLFYALVYFGFGLARESWQVWALFAAYGLFFALTEGAEKALVADLVPAARRGTAYGWYHLVVGLGALPASLLFGALWETVGPEAAFGVGAGLSAAAALGLALWAGPGGASAGAPPAPRRP